MEHGRQAEESYQGEYDIINYGKYFISHSFGSNHSSFLLRTDLYLKPWR